jgi:hypothetical protein
MRRPRTLAVAAAGLMVVGVAIVLAIVLTDGGGPKRDGAAAQLSHADYARLWQRTRVGESRSDALAGWPKPPYQHYTDNLQDECFEWQDKPTYLYNLCFKGGVLRSKAVF